ncbi:MAG: hypothetical protein ACRCYW_15230 [Aeromonas sp.]|uniref:hypothetical protein n=1 Tax=Aeromonas sp. TaxID=647 RepID=UPI003F3DA3EF
MLLLVPLSALASCPMGLQLSNVPISVELPFCVKWESSSLGGCAVACPDVCVEIPGAGTKGPIQTTGSECKLGGSEGGSEGGGEGEGGGETPNPGNGGFSTPPKLVGEMNIGGSNITNISSGFNSLLNESWWIKSGIGDIRRNSFDLNTHAISIQENTDKMAFHLKFLSDKAIESSDKLDANFKSVLDALNSGGSGSPGDGDSKIYNELSQLHIDMFGQNFAENSGGFSMMAQLRGLSYDVLSMKDRVHEAASDIHNLYTYVMPDLRNNSIEMNRNVKSIADAIKNGGIGGGDGGSSGGGLGQAYWDNKFGEAFGRLDRDYFGGTQNIDRSTSSMAQNMAAMTSQLGLNGVNGHLIDIKEALKSGGSSGGEGGGDIDYSKMPGAAGNPLQVAGAEYESGLCQEGDNCAFDLGNINKQYDDKKEELKDKYKAIKDEVAEIFKFDLSGSGSVPKCFELYSLFGKSYSVCPSVGGYWEALAAIMMFVFYFLALMIVARR